MRQREQLGIPSVKVRKYDTRGKRDVGSRAPRLVPTNRALVRRLSEAWNTGNLDILDEFLHPEWVSCFSIGAYIFSIGAYICLAA
jgi:hypothetical protein